MEIPKDRDTVLLIDSSLHSRRIFSIIENQSETAEEGYQELKYRYIEGILGFIDKFSPKEVIIACDSRTNWRRNIFKYYKAHRKIERDRKEKDEKSWVKWDEYYKVLTEVEELIKKSLPIKVLNVDECEADDICGILCGNEKFANYNKVVVSNDNDYVQLLMNHNTYLYNPISKDFIQCENPKEELLIKVCLGDDGDFIPSIQNKEIFKDSFLDYCVKKLNISEVESNAAIILNENEDVFMDSSLKYLAEFGLKASRSMKFKKTKIIDLIAKKELMDFLNEDDNKEIKRKFVRNNKLINLTNQPKEIKERIVKSYEEYPSLPKLTNWFSFVYENKFNGLIGTNVSLILGPLCDTKSLQNS